MIRWSTEATSSFKDLEQWIQLKDIHINVQPVPYNINSYHFELFKPEIALFLYLMLILMFSANSRKYYRKKDLLIFTYLYILFLLCCIGVFIFFRLCDLNTYFILFNSAIIIDFYVLLVKVLIIMSTIIILMSSLRNLLRLRKDAVEFPILIGFAVFFLLVFIGAFSTISLFLSLEGLSFILYTLAILPFTSSSIEAAIKYFILGGLSSGFLLGGIICLYSITKGGFDFLYIKHYISLHVFDQRVYIALFLIIFSFCFKLSLYPCHMWAVDVYEGTWMPVTAFFMIVIKMGIFLYFLRFIFYLFGSFKTMLFFFLINICLGSILVGSIGALPQTNLKRLFAYSSISQIGFCFLPLLFGEVGITYALVFFSVYSIAILGIFIILLNTETLIRRRDLISLSDLSNFGSHNIWESVCFSFLVLSLAGMPPLGGFFTKYLIFSFLIEKGYFLITIFVILISILNTFVYIRIIKCLFFDQWSVKKIEDYDKFWFTIILYRRINTAILVWWTFKFQYHFHFNLHITGIFSFINCSLLYFFTFSLFYFSFNAQCFVWAVSFLTQHLLCVTASLI